VDAHLADTRDSGEPIELEVSWETSHTRGNPGEVRYVHQMSVSASAAQDFHIDCSYELIYLLPDDAQVDDEDLDAFGEVSVSFSAFPYVRELVQSLTTRASLPALVLGTLRSPIDPPAEGSPEDE
jgi:preprotein translocase subunit SecB